MPVARGGDHKKEILDLLTSTHAAENVIENVDARTDGILDAHAHLRTRIPEMLLGLPVAKDAVNLSLVLDIKLEDGRHSQQHIATHCSTLQHTAAHCITLQHIAV
jgi:hypothetical protein